MPNTFSPTACLGYVIGPPVGASMGWVADRKAEQSGESKWEDPQPKRNQLEYPLDST